MNKENFLETLEKARQLLWNNNCQIPDYRIYHMCWYDAFTEEQRKQVYRNHGGLKVYFLKCIFTDNLMTQELYLLKEDGSLEKYEQKDNS